MIEDDDDDDDDPFAPEKGTPRNKEREAEGKGLEDGDNESEFSADSKAVRRNSTHSTGEKK